MKNLIVNAMMAGMKGVFYGIAGALAVFLAQIGTVPGPPDAFGHALWVSLVVPVVVGIAKMLERIRTFDPKRK